MDENKKLSEKEYWDEVLKKKKLPFRVKMKQYSPWLINSFFSEIIKNGKFRTLIEVGAGSSAWLPFLSQEYNLEVSGLDYSEIGCKLCEENLKMSGIKYNEVICSDIFNWQSDKKYDIVISLGVIEHFDNPEEILGILRNHLNQNGILITVVPNFMGLSGKLTRCFLPGVSAIHKVISRKQLTEMHENSGYKCIKADYTGFFYPFVIPWASKSDGILFRKGTLLRNIVLKIIEIKNVFITKLLRAARVSRSSEYFSPFIIYVGKIKSSS
jgi:2-polyprenyl-3-methyl-5-hydroxy-6-metoxy-1,4-benzoquinol methylase